MCSSNDIVIPEIGEKFKRQEKRLFSEKTIKYFNHHLCFYIDTNGTCNIKKKLLAPITHPWHDLYKNLTEGTNDRRINRMDMDLQRICVHLYTAVILKIKWKNHRICTNQMKLLYVFLCDCRYNEVLYTGCI